MRSFSALTAIQLLLSATFTTATFQRGHGLDIGPPVRETREIVGTNNTNGWGTFDQLIDHNNPSLGTFPQRFWYGLQNWDGPVSRLIIYALIY